MVIDLTRNKKELKKMSAASKSNGKTQLNKRHCAKAIK